MTRTYSRIAESFIGPSPIVLRAVNPVPTPKMILPGASLLSVANAAAQDGAMRLLGTITPVPSLIFEVCSAASAIETKMSGKSSCES